MPLHDWTRVDAGIFHDFHIGWISSLTIKLNSILLPPDYHALIEKTVCDQDFDAIGLRGPQIAPLTAEAEERIYTAKQRRLVIRHSSGNRIVALLEIVSPGSKSSRHEFQRFLDKAIAALEAGIHLLLIDVQPPSKRDPQGIHGAIWEELTGESYDPPAGKDSTLVTYTGGRMGKGYVEPIAIGQALTPMPLFLTAERYINVPLEETYQASYEGVPRIYRQMLEI